MSVRIISGMTVMRHSPGVIGDVHLGEMRTIMAIKLPSAGSPNL